MYSEFFNSDIFEVAHKQIVDPKREEFSKHMHTYCEMLLFISGDVEYNIDGHIYKPVPYDLLLIPKETYHYLMPNAKTLYENYIISFSDSLLTKEQYDKIFSYPLIINVERDKELLGYFRRIDSFRENYSFDDFVAATRHNICQVLIYCSYMDKKSVKNAPKENTVINQIIDFINENIEDDINAAMIAQRFNLSCSHVQNLFSTKMHIGLKQYILQKKIFAARNAVKSGMQPHEAAERYAFNDYSGFYRLYKKTFGTAPKYSRR